MAYEAYTSFEQCKIHESTSITDHIVEFEWKYNQIKKQKMVLPEPVLAFKLLHSPRQIISTMCKTGQDALRKRKPCRKLFIHISNKSASNKLKNVSIEPSKLLCLNGISFCSKSCKLKTFPLSIASMLALVVDGPRS